MLTSLRIYFTANHSAVTVETNGVSREASGRSMAAVINGMHEADREVFARFCEACLQASQGDSRALSATEGQV